MKLNLYFSVKDALKLFKMIVFVFASFSHSNRMAKGVGLVDLD